jgi:hypothetical protein
VRVDCSSVPSWSSGRESDALPLAARHPLRPPGAHRRTGRIHGRRHAGVRLVQEGATLLPVLDAHRGREQPFGVEELVGYRQAQPPPDQHEALRRRQVMRRARSKKKRGQLLAELEQRYREGS